MQLDDILGKERKRIAMKKIQVKQQKQEKKERNDNQLCSCFPTHHNCKRKGDGHCFSMGELESEPCTDAKTMKRACFDKLKERTPN